MFVFRAVNVATSAYQPVHCMLKRHIGNVASNKSHQGHQPISPAKVGEESGREERERFDSIYQLFLQIILNRNAKNAHEKWRSATASPLHPGPGLCSVYHMAQIESGARGPWQQWLHLQLLPVPAGGTLGVHLNNSPGGTNLHVYPVAEVNPTFPPSINMLPAPSLVRQESNAQNGNPTTAAHAVIDTRCCPECHANNSGRCPVQ